VHGWVLIIPTNNKNLVAKHNLKKKSAGYFEIQKVFRHLSKYINKGNLNTLFKALNDPTRREILELLKVKDLTAGEIADQFNISKPSISHHLDLLRQAGLVVSVKEGQFIYYSLNTTVMDEMLKWIVSLQSKKS
jgi:ArsR family transcriptional regulator